MTGWTAGNFEGRWNEGILTFEGSNAGNFNDIFEVEGSTLTLRTGEPPPVGFAAWIEGYGITGDDALPGADPQRDGLSNLFIYSQGGDPTIPGSVARPVATPEGGNLTLSFARIADPDLVYTVWASNDLEDWGAAPLWTSTGAQNTVGPVTVTDTAGGKRRFLRLSVDL